MCTRRVVGIIASAVAATVLFLVAEGDVAAGSGGSGYESEQGTRIFGTWNPSLEGVLIRYVPTTQQYGYVSLSIKGGQLKKTLEDQSESTDVVGMRLVGTTGGARPSSVNLIIRGASPHASIYTHEHRKASGGVWEYKVMVQNVGGLKPLCDDGPNLALVVPNAWKTGQLSNKEDDDKGFTFSCVPILVPNPAATLPAQNAASVSTQQAPQIRQAPQITRQPIDIRLLIEHPRWHGGAAAKCIDYGYAPWALFVPALGQTTVAGGKMPPSSNAAARSFHNVCVHVMTADYAGNGQSHTISGSVIKIFDLTNLPVKKCDDTATQPPACTQTLPNRPVASRPVSPASNLHVSPTLARLNVRQYAAHRLKDLLFEGVWTEDEKGAHVICLTKERWQAIDPVDITDVSQADDPDGDNTDCEALTLEDLVAFAGSDKPLLVSYSAINGRHLWRFRTGTGWVTTSHVRFTKNGPRIDARIPCKEPCELIHEGYVVSPDAPTTGLDTVVALYLYKNDNGDYITTTVSNPPTGYHAVYPSAQPSSASTAIMAQPEGYLFAQTPHVPESSPFYTDAQPRKLQLWSLGEKHCTTSHHECKGYHLDKQLGGFVIFRPEQRDSPFRLPLLASTPPLIIHFGDPGPDIHERKPEETLGTAGTIQNQ